MEHAVILRDLTAMMAAALLTVYLLGKIGVPATVGFLVAGIAIGPGALGLVKDPHAIETIAEIGVALLLFTIGLKFSLGELAAMRDLVLGVGVGQVVLTIGVVLGIAITLGLAFPQALFIGFLVALSSTAIVIKLLEARNETGSRHGRIILAVLILQDLAIIPMMLITPGLAKNGGTLTEVGLALVKALAMVILLLIVTRRVFPWVLDRLVNLRSREVFTIGTLLLALGTAYAATLAGLSLALGAFLAGIVLADSDYSHQILAEITPFRDTFASLFFVSVGMLANPMLIVEQPFVILGLTFGVILLKALAAGGSVALFGFGGRVAVLSGLALAQVGEFSFILAQVGVDAGVIKEALYQPFLMVSVLTMAATPWLMQGSHALAEKLGEKLSARKPVPGSGHSEETLNDHTIIIGYGINGRNVARVLRSLAVPYVVIELNPAIVRSQAGLGEPIQYGDATQRTVLDSVWIEDARAMVVAISDPASSRQIVAVARKMHPDLFIVVRTRYLSEMDDLLRLGADAVVPEEFETSLELAGMVMQAYGAPDRLIEREQEAMREEHYGLLTGARISSRRQPLRDLMRSADIKELPLPPVCPSVGKTLQELALRPRSGASIIGVRRGDEIIANPPAEFVLWTGDHLLVLGTQDEVDKAAALLDPANDEASEPDAIPVEA